MFGCFKRVCIIERNTNECFGETVISKDSQSLNNKKPIKSNYKVQDLEEEVSDQEQGVLAVRNPSSIPWNPPSELKFPCPLMGHKHEVRKCKEFFLYEP